MGNHVIAGAHRRRLVLFVALVAALVATVLPAGAQTSAPGAVDADGFHLWGDPHDVGNVDRREGTVAASAQQRAIAADLGASAVRWNDFGTPHVLIKHGSYLSGPRDGAAVDVARDWIRDHKTLFRLSDAQVDGLEVLRDSPLYDAPDLTRVRDGQAPRNRDVAHAVLFRQTFGDLHAAWDGLLTVGVQRDGRIAWVSSSVTGDDAVEGSRQLSAADAVAAAAGDAGVAVGALREVDSPADDWTTFESDAVADLQRARLVALPTPTDGVRLAYEVTVIDSTLDDHSNHPQAFISFVDAEHGTVWLRRNAVDNFADGAGLAQATPTGGTFEGNTAEGEDSCGQPHPFEAAEGTKEIELTASPTAPDIPDVALFLVFDGEVVANDLLTSPEALRYAPRGGVPAGTYSALVCQGEAGAASFDYVGTFTTSPAPGNVEVPFELPRWRVFPANPPFVDAADPSADTRELWCWVNDAEACDEQQQNSASRVPWDVNPPSAPSFTTDGNNATTAISEVSPFTPDTLFDRPLSAERNYDFTWDNTWSESACNPVNFATDNDDAASTVNLFVMHNRMHDWSYYLGFTEGNSNLQKSNFGNTAPDRENDPEQGQAQAGRTTVLGRDNANQITLQDGVAPITNQYLWEPLAGAFYGTCTDGAYDMAIVAHEYTHAISNRMIAGPDTGTGDSQGQTESWSDLGFAEYFRGFGIVASPDANPFALAPYVTGNLQTGIRNYGMNNSPLNYSDIGYDGNGLTSPHANGEIWSATNFDISLRLNEKYDAEFPSSDADLQERCARGELAADACPGNRRWAQLMFDGFLLQPAGSSMIDSRDSMLAADMLRFDGANQVELWDAFAARGLGETAFSDGVKDGDPIPGWSSPVATDEARVRFQPADVGGGVPATMEVYTGAYEARITPTADTDPETARISDTVEFVPGTYEFIARADGFGAYRFSLTLEPGADLVVDVPLRRNHASATNGATATGDGVNLDQLIDDSEATNWASLADDADQSPDEEGRQVEGRQVTVKLGDEPVTVAEVQVSAALRGQIEETEDGDAPPDPGSQSRFSALRSFDILACDASTGADCSDDASYTQIFASVDDAFPGSRPRPLAPNLTLRPFDVADTQATHIRLRVRDNQCTGGPDYQGDVNEVNDPVFSSPDCDSEAFSAGQAGPRPVLNPPEDIVRAAELQVFSEPAPAIGGETDGAADRPGGDRRPERPERPGEQRP
jgi:extracellular elastinolytic metalloproteinase